MAGFAISIALAVVIYLAIGFRLIRAGKWIAAGLAMFGVSFIPVLYEMAYTWLTEASSSVAMSAVFVLLWPPALLVILVGLIRMMSRKGSPIDVQ